MTDTGTPTRGARRVSHPGFFGRLLPTIIDRRLRVAAWVSFIAEVVIIGTGGAVRLTGSGLGCSEWPLCTPESLVPIYEMQGIHGIIEFGNRLMTGVVGIIAIIVLLWVLHIFGGVRQLLTAVWFALAGIAFGLVCFLIASLAGLPGFPFLVAGVLLTTIVAAIHSVRTTPGRRDLIVLAWIVLIGVVAQAFVGGITVLTELNAFIVGFHYVSSLLLACVTAAFLIRMDTPAGASERVVPRWYAVLAKVTGLPLAMTILFGVLTTGSGPHSGDAAVIRDGFDATFLAHVHAWPGYALVALLALLTLLAWVRHLPVQRWMLLLVITVVVQIVVGVIQARTGLPAILVGIHMVLAALSAAAYTVVMLRLRRPVAAEA